jgi:hypothetical protein
MAALLIAARTPDARRADDARRTLLALHAHDAPRARRPLGPLPSIDPEPARRARQAPRTRRAPCRQLPLHVLLQEVDLFFLGAQAPHLLAHHSHLVRHCALPAALRVLDVAEP